MSSTLTPRCISGVNLWAWTLTEVPTCGVDEFVALEEVILYRSHLSDLLLQSTKAT
jgi:hypothetical protein